MNNDRKIAVVLLSGGMDSTLCTAIAKEMNYDIAALHVNYGQKTEKRELKAFIDISKHYDAVEKMIVDVSHLSKIGNSSLTDSNIEVSKADIENASIPTSYVSYRNGNLLSIAASWAEVIRAEAIFIGAMQLDSSGYPDCRQSFFDAFQKAINLGTKPETNINIITPIINYTKRDIIAKGLEFELPFELTWSCYKDEIIACGECDSCALRLRGFQELGVDDPIPYNKTPDYLGR